MADMQRLRLIFVGGYLGAGKTTLLAEAARRLVAGGRRVGLVTNDQAAGLVDTEILRDVATGVGEIAGGCLCCRWILANCERRWSHHRLWVHRG